MAEQAVFVSVSWEGLVLRLKVCSITYMVHLVVARLLLVHWYYAWCTIISKEFSLFRFSVLLKLVYVTSGASLSDIEITCYLLSTCNLLFNIVVADIGISLWNLCLGVVHISIVNGVAETDFSLWGKIPFRLMWMLDLGRGLRVFVDVWETFSIETEAAERFVTDVNIWTFDS